MTRFEFKQNLGIWLAAWYGAKGFTTTPVRKGFGDTVTMDHLTELIADFVEDKHFTGGVATFEDSHYRPSIKSVVEAAVTNTDLIKVLKSEDKLEELSDYPENKLI